MSTMTDVQQDKFRAGQMSRGTNVQQDKCPGGQISKRIDVIEGHLSIEQFDVDVRSHVKKVH